MKLNIAAGLSLLLIVTFAATAAAIPGQSADPALAAASVAVTPTASPTATPNPAPTPASTSAPLPTVEYQKACITIEDHLPADLRPGGALLLHGSEWRNWGSNSMYHLDLMSLRKSPLPSTTDYVSLSPDGKWLAYLDITRDKKNHQKERILQVTNADGQRLDMSYWGLDWQYLIGWQDEKHLILAAPGYSGGDFLTLNPFTTHKEVIGIDIPGLRTKDYWYYPERVFPNAALSHWVIDTEEEPGWRLLERDGWRTLWEGENSYYNTPIWSPDGRYFMIVDDLSKPRDERVDWSLFRVGLDGSAVRITNRIGEYKELSWSPDSRFIAGWVAMDPVEITTPNHMVLIDVEKPMLTDLCFENQTKPGYEFIDNTAPVWSPDGRFLAIGVSRYEVHEPDSKYPYYETFWDTALIDLQEMRGYLLVKNVLPQLWMRKR